MKKKSWLIIAVICLILGMSSLAGGFISSKNAVCVETYGITTGEQNQCLAYDSESGIMYVATHNGKLAAYKDGTEIWNTKVEGAYKEIVLNETKDKLYTANENNHIYVYQTANGSQLLDINVQRKVVAITVSADDSKLAVITNTGSSKSNMIVYKADGEELSNVSYKTALRGIEYCNDGENLYLGNRRGEILIVTEEGKEIQKVSLDYEIRQIQKIDDYLWAVNKIGEFVKLDENLEIVKKGKIDNSINAKVLCFGVSNDEKYVLVGTEDGYVFVVNEEGKQVYMADHHVFITNAIAVGDHLVFTGFADFITQVNTDGLEHQRIYETIGEKLSFATVGFVVLAVLFAIQSIPEVHENFIKIGKRMWKNKMAYVMLIPTFTLLFLFSWRGIYVAITRAFTDWSSSKTTLAEINFTGLENFRIMITEGYFLTGIQNLLRILVTNILKRLTVPMLVAWLLYSIKGDKRKYFHRFLFVLPVVVPGVVSALIWQKIYDPTIGLLNQVLGAVGLENWQQVWLGNEKTAIWAVIFMGFPFVDALTTLVYYGGLINIDENIIESALLDGARKWDIFWKVQLPMIRPQISVMMTLTVLASMTEFNSIYILTSGGPGTATYVPALELYLNASLFGRYGYASALGVILLVFTVLATITSNKLTKGEKY